MYMKKIVIALLGLLCVTCAKAPINGDLDGFWQLAEIAYKKGTVTDTHNDGLFYSVQLKLIGLQKGGNNQYLGRFVQTEDSLFVYDFRLNITGDNSQKAAAGDLQAWGIPDTTERFAIEKLNGKEMILTSATARLSFRKW